MSQHDPFWDDLEDVEEWEPTQPAVPTSGRPPVQCLCGRFARYFGVTHGYNGNYATETMTVECSRCGVVDIELV